MRRILIAIIFLSVSTLEARSIQMKYEPEWIDSAEAITHLKMGSLREWYMWNPRTPLQYIVGHVESMLYDHIVNRMKDRSWSREKIVDRARDVVKDLAYLALCMYKDTSWLPRDDIWAIHYKPGEWVREIIEMYNRDTMKGEVEDCGVVSLRGIELLLKAATPMPLKVEKFLIAHRMWYDEKSGRLYEDPPVKPWIEEEVNGFKLHYLMGKCEDCIDTEQLNTIREVLRNKKRAVEELIGSESYDNIDIYVYDLHWAMGVVKESGAVLVRNSTKRAWIRIHSGLKGDELRSVIVHEYSHYLQMRGTDEMEEPLWMEGTSVWTELKLYPDVGEEEMYEYLRDGNSILINPQLSLFYYDQDNYTRPYSGIIFLKYIEDQYGEERIRLIWSKCWMVKRKNTISAMASSFGGADGFKRVYQNFMIANYFKDYRGINTDMMPSVAAENIYLTRGYIKKMRNSDIDKWMQNLGTRYVVLLLLSNNTFGDSVRAYVEVKTGELKKKATKSIENRICIVRENWDDSRDTIYIDEIPEDSTEILLRINSRVLFTFNNVSLYGNDSNDIAIFGYRISRVPVIKTYTLNKSLYHPGDTVEMELEISDSVFRGGGRLVEADFSSMGGGEAVYEKESNNPRKVKIKYVIPRTTREGEYEVRIKAYDPAVVIEHLRNHIPNEVKVRVKVGNKK